MIKRHWQICLVILCYLINIGWADNRLELTAPGGGEMDLGKNLMKYYASGSQLVTVRWDNYILEAAYLEYYRNQSVLNGKDRVKLIQTKPETRVLTSGVIQLKLNSNFYTASQDVVLTYDQKTRISGGELEWDQARSKVRLTGEPLIVYGDWKISGTQIEGLIDQGLFMVTGKVRAANNEITIVAGKLTFDRRTEQYILENNPELVKGQSRLTASEIVYNLKTKKISAKGMVQSQIIKEKQ
ncbi:MAG TPA: LptA/OstA family protein [Bacillota bacterium]